MNGDDYVDQAVHGLGSSAVFVDSDASLSSAGAIADAYDGTGIAVVALPALAAQTFSPSTLASQILKQTDDYEAVIVVIDSGRDSIGVAAHKSADATTIATAVNAHNSGDGGAGVLAAASEIKDSGAVSSVPHGGDGFGVGEVLVGGGSLLGILAVTALGIAAVKRYRNRAAGDRVLQKGVPDHLEPALAKLRAIEAQHAVTGASPLSSRIHSIRTNIGQLFTRIGRTGTEQQAKMASVQYADVIGKLNRALGEDYYLDIVRNPRLWDDPDGRRREVEEAVVATDEQLVENIRQVNASQDLEFKVALESLVGSMNTTVKDVYSSKGDEGDERTDQH